MNDFMTYKITPEEKERMISAFKDRLEKYNEIIFAYIFGSFVDNETPFSGILISGYILIKM